MNSRALKIISLICSSFFLILLILVQGWQVVFVTRTLNEGVRVTGEPVGLEIGLERGLEISDLRNAVYAWGEEGDRKTVRVRYVNQVQDKVQIGVDKPALIAIDPKNPTQGLLAGNGITPRDCHSWVNWNIGGIFVFMVLEIFIIYRLVRARK